MYTKPTHRLGRSHPGSKNQTHTQSHAVVGLSPEAAAGSGPSLEAAGGKATGSSEVKKHTAGKTINILAGSMNFYTFTTSINTFNHTILPSFLPSLPEHSA